MHLRVNYVYVATLIILSLQITFRTHFILSADHITFSIARHHRYVIWFCYEVKVTKMQLFMSKIEICKLFYTTENRLKATRHLLCSHS